MKKLRNDRGVFELTGKSVSDEGLSGYDKISFSYGSFWWVPLSMWQNYGCTIYEGHWDYNNQDENGRPTWVRGTQVASLDFYPYQDAALVYLNTSAAPFSLSQYYHTIDYDTDLPPGYLRHGYSEGYWTYLPFQWNPNYPHHRPWFYMGYPGSPRFHYRQLCSVIIPPPPRTPSNTRPR